MQVAQVRDYENRASDWSTFCELTTVSSESTRARLGLLSSFMILSRFFSRTVGNCEEPEATDGLGRRPREPEDSLLSFVEFVEVLIDEECLRSVAEFGYRFFAASANGSHAGSCLNGWSILRRT